MKTHPKIRCGLYVIALLLVVFTSYVAWVFAHDWHRRVQRSLAYNAWEGNTVRMRLCLALGASPNGTVEGTGPALTSAAAAGRLDSIRFLLSHGCDINIHDKWGLTPLMQVSNEGHLEAARLLLDAGADPNAVSQGYEPGATALGVARNQPGITELLLNHGAKPRKSQ